jgi:hypothetical protein
MKEARGLGCSSGAEHLPSLHEALGFITSTPQKIKTTAKQNKRTNKRDTMFGV